MSHRYATAFNTKAFIPFTLLGWPDVDTSFNIIKTMIDSGATALELGFPFSDPVADGPIIQAAAFQTIENGFTLSDAFTLLKRVRDYNATIPIGLLLYYNTILAQVPDQFYKRASAAGVDSILIADLPADCAEEISQIARTNHIAQVFIISPLTDDARLQKVTAVADAYLYVVSRLGITGTHEEYDAQLGSLLQRARKTCDLPLCVGFGISTPEQAQKMITLGADGVITGSRIIQMMQQNLDFTALSEYIKSMLASLSRSSISGSIHAL